MPENKKGKWCTNEALALIRQQPTGGIVAAFVKEKGGDFFHGATVKENRNVGIHH
jgi:hypothetical protein